MSIEFAKVTLTSAGTSTRTLTAQLRMTGNTGADDDAEPADGAEIVQPLGVISRPSLTPTTEAAYVRVGDEIVVIALLDKGAAAMELEEGETRLYGAAKPGAVVRIREAGDIDVEPHTAKHIKLGASATKAVALHQDAVTQSAEFYAWMSLVSTAAGVTPLGPFDSIGLVSASATKVKGE